jgi:hypothetical protein
VVTFEETSDKVECHEFGDNSKKDWGRSGAAGTS